MKTLILPEVNGSDKYTEIDVQARIISAETACHKASYFLAMNVGHLLRAENPKLLLDKDELEWQLEVVLTSPSGKPSQHTSYIYLSAQDGSVLATEETIAALATLANAGTAN